MGRKGDIRYVSNAVGNATGKVLTPLNAIPAEVIAEVEEIFSALSENPNGRMRVEYDKPEEVEAFANLVDSYCQQRPVEKGGPIRFRRSPVKGAPKTQMDFRITRIPTPEEEAANKAAKEAVAAAQAAANGSTATPQESPSPAKKAAPAKRR